MALVDRDEKLHDDCVAALEKWTGPVVTTEAVLTETLYLVGPAWRAQKACLEFILRGAFQLVPSSTKSLQRVAVLMEKYRNVPMDFADATLAVLAEELETEWCSHWTGADLPPTGCTETELSRSSLSWNNYPFSFFFLACFLPNPSPFTPHLITLSARNSTNGGIVKLSCFRRLEIDCKLKFCRLLDGQVGGLGAFQDFVHIGGRAAIDRKIIGGI